MTDVARAALESVLRSPTWKGMGGLDESTMYGELAIEVARVAIAAEREACAKIAEAWESCNHDGCASSVVDAIKSRNP